MLILLKLSSSTGTPSTYSWTFPGGTPATSSEQNPIISYNSAGTYTVTLNVANLNGDDSEIQTTFITVLSPQNLPLIEGFTGIAFPPLGWSILNTDQGSTWTRNSTVGLAPSSGNSMIFLNYSENDIGNQDEFRSPILSFTNLLSAQISFDVAYAAYNASYIDGLEVLISSDCGFTWNSLYLKTGLTVGPGNLPTAPPTTSNFTPTSAQWRNETINLDQYIGEPSVRIAFRNLPAYGNNLYIDNINISGVFIPPPVANFSSSTPLICQGETVQYIRAKLSNEVRYRNVALNNTILYQNVMDGDSVYNVPEIVTRHSLYYTNEFFKKALFLQTGVTFSYFSRYYMNRYDPLLAEFYVQNTSELGDFPRIDFFINAKIRQTRIFLKAEHLNSSFTGYNFYSAPNYPYRDFIVRFGIVWNFFL